ncbi:MAG: hypothetical protein CYG59_17960 [Chloroflexi bacterium]|nr:MAG: hypothetical protein CYG59_17960 [Chloroflexota bacterium]
MMLVLPSFHRARSPAGQAASSTAMGTQISIQRSSTACQSVSEGISAAPSYHQPPAVINVGGGVRVVRSGQIRYACVE